MQLGVILCATDFSAGAAAAFGAACTLARETTATLLIVHVHEVPLGADEPPALDDPLQRELAALAERARAAGVARVDSRLLHGHAWHRIVDLARAAGAALIVLGLHGRSGARHDPIGRVAEEVTRNASCSVLVVRPPRLAAAA